MDCRNIRCYYFLLGSPGFGWNGYRCLFRWSLVEQEQYGESYPCLGRLVSLTTPSVKELS